MLRHLIRIKNNNQKDLMKKEIIDPDSSNGFKNEKFFSIAILILIIIAIGGFAILRSDAELNFDFLRGEITPENQEEVEDEEGIQLEDEEETDVEEVDEDHEEDEDVDEPAEEDTDLVHYEEEEDDVEILAEEEATDYTGPTYRATAEPGDGLTHVARRAYQGHIQSRGNGDGLTAEHEVFIEDYIQKNLDHDTGWLQLGETVEIPESLIDEAIEEAHELTEDQLQNLSQYTVSS